MQDYKNVFGEIDNNMIVNAIRRVLERRSLEESVLNSVQVRTDPMTLCQVMIVMDSLQDIASTKQSFLLLFSLFSPEQSSSSTNYSRTLISIFKNSQLSFDFSKCVK